MLILYKTSVQLHLDGVQLWYLNKIQDMKTLKAIQRSYATHINGFHT